MEVKARSKKISDLRAYLETERERLRQEIARSNITTDEERAGYSNHMAENATVVFEQARNAALRRSEERMLEQVEDALKRMDDGTYGICRRCGEQIDLARLKALPTASLCLRCQHLLEHS
ncbi:MAG: TraR/DksA C4-type zinc finger protein [Chloroflexi bacterium]|nr:TraR/DksA C4-type zinc finger protein [Chloroflexota bacterium]